MAVVLENVDTMPMSITEIMADVTSRHRIPQVKQMQLLTHLRLARNFSSFHHRLKCVMARLQAISVLGEGERGRGEGGKRCGEGKRERERERKIERGQADYDVSSTQCTPLPLKKWWILSFTKDLSRN